MIIGEKRLRGVPLSQILHLLPKFKLLGSFPGLFKLNFFSSVFMTQVHFNYKIYPTISQSSQFPRIYIYENVILQYVIYYCIHKTSNLNFKLRCFYFQYSGRWVIEDPALIWQRWFCLCSPLGVFLFCFVFNFILFNFTILYWFCHISK